MLCRCMACLCHCVCLYVCVREGGGAGGWGVLGVVVGGVVWCTAWGLLLQQGEPVLLSSRAPLSGCSCECKCTW